MTAIWISIIGCGFVLEWRFLLSRGVKIKNRTRIYAEKIY
ncbi:Uncharacterised protein [Staphylococcus aureus]|nr:Uncharacterised protein [Staphylococcus aureus]